MATEELTCTRLAGGPPPGNIQPLEEVIRPFGVTDRGICFLEGGTRVALSYHDLAGRIAVAAARLRRGGVRPGAFIAVSITNDLTSALAILGAWAAGATVLSLPPPGRRKAREWYSQQFGAVLDVIGCTMLIGDDDMDDVLPRLRRVSKQALAEPGDEPARLPDMTIPDTALIQFTSGSIGTPKGVAISGAALTGNIAACVDRGSYDGHADRIGSWLPMYHDMGLIAMFLTGLATRMDQVLAAPSSFAAQPASWLSMLARERVTITAAPDFAYRLAAAVPYAEDLDLSRMRVAVCGGERVNWQTLLNFHATTERMGFSWGALVPCYGMAENAVAVTANTPGRGPVRGPGGQVSVGQPLRGVELRVADGSSPGPVELRSSWRFGGYHTDGGFEPVAEGSWFDTGDAGFTSDNGLYIMGRRDEVVAMAGRNVFAEDVESVSHEAAGNLIGACAAFRNSTGTARFALMAEANPRLVKSHDDARELGLLIRSSVTEVLGARLAPVLVVRLGTIPRTTSGKVQRALSRSIYDEDKLGRRLIAELA
jgi:fatty-acyl-CoA synthase